MMCARLFLFTGMCVVMFFGRAATDCPLPSHPLHGRHQPQGGDCAGSYQHPACVGTTGTLAPEDWILTVQCDPGYQHSDPNSADVPSICANGRWTIPQLAPCVLPDLLSNDRERCAVPQPPPHSQYRLLAEECGGENLPPGSPVPHDCILFLDCDQGYQRREGMGDLLAHCTNKTWNPSIPDNLCIKAVDPSLTQSTPPPEIFDSVSPPSTSSTGCELPNSSSTRKFCSLDAGCENCDIHTRRCHVPPGSRVDKIKIVCSPGYTIQTSNIAVCLTSGWYPALPKCLKLCRPLVSEELLLKCRFGADPVACSKPSLPGTTVTFQCLPSFTEYPDLKRQGAYRNIITCDQSGEWSENLPPCKPGCGVSKESKQFSPTILDGQNANIGFFPWHAGLYYRVEEDGRVSWDQKCGGSLITDRVVITAAHCVYEVTDVNSLRVALGKYYRSWDAQEVNQVKRNVSEIAFPSQYNHNILRFDIALVLLSERITFGEYIMPACRDYNEATNHLQNTKLYVVGWGKISSAIGGPSSDNLLYNTVTPMPENECDKALPIYYSSFEKFCAVKNNSESIIQKGDSGGGLTAVYEDGLHYIIGIVSSKYDQVSIFTNIKWKTHTEWIDSKIRQFKNKYGS